MRNRSAYGKLCSRVAELPPEGRQKSPDETLKSGPSSSPKVLSPRMGTRKSAHRVWINRIFINSPSVARRLSQLAAGKGRRVAVFPRKIRLWLNAVLTLSVFVFMYGVWENVSALCRMNGTSMNDFCVWNVYFFRWNKNWITWKSFSGCFFFHQKLFILYKKILTRLKHILQLHMYPIVLLYKIAEWRYYIIYLSHLWQIPYNF